MTDIAAAPAGRPWYFRIPILGHFARDLSEDFHGNIWYFLTMVVSLTVIAVATWGLPALGLIALATVPVIFLVLILISRG